MDMSKSLPKAVIFLATEHVRLLCSKAHARELHSVDGGGRG